MLSSYFTRASLVLPRHWRPSPNHRLQPVPILVHITAFSENYGNLVSMWKRTLLIYIVPDPNRYAQACSEFHQHQRPFLSFYQRKYRLSEKHFTLRPWINQITWPNSCNSSCKITFSFYKMSSWKFGKYNRKR